MGRVLETDSVEPTRREQRMQSRDASTTAPAPYSLWKEAGSNMKVAKQRCRSAEDRLCSVLAEAGGESTGQYATDLLNVVTLPDAVVAWGTSVRRAKLTEAHVRKGITATFGCDSVDACLEAINATRHTTTQPYASVQFQSMSAPAASEDSEDSEGAGGSEESAA